MKKNHRNTCRSIHAATIGFRTHFNIDALRFMDPLMTAMTGRYNLDVMNLDNWLHKQGYSEEMHGSMKEYIYTSYGKEAMDFIISLLLIRSKEIRRRTKKIKEN